MIDNKIIGDAHLHAPFTIGLMDPQKGYIHTFDDTTLNIVMTTLDTISDFTAYLGKKEQFLTGRRAVFAAGEEELLAIYLKNMNSAGEHDFVVEANIDAIAFPEGFWDAFAQNPQRLAQLDHNQISYAWDELISKFAFHAMTGTQYFTSGRPLREQEATFRILAREPRTRRRMLALSLKEVWEKSLHPGPACHVRVQAPLDSHGPHYVFLFLRRRDGLQDAEYRQMRQAVLLAYCKVAKLKFPGAKDIIGIATEGGMMPERSEDLIHIDTSRWNTDDLTEARQIQRQLGLLKNTRTQTSREYEYPVDRNGRPRTARLSRNSPCWCGSHKRFKRCHGKGLFPKSG